MASSPRPATRRLPVAQLTRGASARARSAHTTTRAPSPTSPQDMDDDDDDEDDDDHDNDNDASPSTLPSVASTSRLQRQHDPINLGMAMAMDMEDMDLAMTMNINIADHHSPAQPQTSHPLPSLSPALAKLINAADNGSAKKFSALLQENAAWMFWHFDKAQPLLSALCILPSWPPDLTYDIIYAKSYEQEVARRNGVSASGNDPSDDPSTSSTPMSLRHVSSHDQNSSNSTSNNNSTIPQPMVLLRKTKSAHWTLYEVESIMRKAIQLQVRHHKEIIEIHLDRHTTTTTNNHAELLHYVDSLFGRSLAMDALLKKLGKYVTKYNKCKATLASVPIIPSSSAHHGLSDLISMTSGTSNNGNDSVQLHQHIDSTNDGFALRRTPFGDVIEMYKALRASRSGSNSSNDNPSTNHRNSTTNTTNSTTGSNKSHHTTKDNSNSNKTNNNNTSNAMYTAAEAEAAALALGISVGQHDLHTLSSSVHPHALHSLDPATITVTAPQHHNPSHLSQFPPSSSQQQHHHQQQQQHHQSSSSSQQQHFHQLQQQQQHQQQHQQHQMQLYGHGLKRPHDKAFDDSDSQHHLDSTSDLTTAAQQQQQHHQIHNNNNNGYPFLHHTSYLPYTQQQQQQQHHFQQHHQQQQQQQQQHLLHGQISLVPSSISENSIPSQPPLSPNMSLVESPSLRLTIANIHADTMRVLQQNFQTIAQSVVQAVLSERKDDKSHDHSTTSGGSPDQSDPSVVTPATHIGALNLANTSTHHLQQQHQALVMQLQQQQQQQVRFNAHINLRLEKVEHNLREVKSMFVALLERLHPTLSPTTLTMQPMSLAMAPPPPTMPSMHSLSSPAAIAIPMPQQQQQQQHYPLTMALHTLHQQTPPTSGILPFYPTMYASNTAPPGVNVSTAAPTAVSIPSTTSIMNTTSTAVNCVPSTLGSTTTASVTAIGQNSTASNNSNTLVSPSTNKSVNGVSGNNPGMITNGNSINTSGPPSLSVSALALPSLGTIRMASPVVSSNSGGSLVASPAHLSPHVHPRHPSMAFGSQSQQQQQMHSMNVALPQHPLFQSLSQKQ